MKRILYDLIFPMFIPVKNLLVHEAVLCKDPKGRQNKFKSIFLTGVCWRMTFGERFCDHVELVDLMLGIHSGTRGVMTEG